MNVQRIKLLYREVSKNQRLAARRHPMFEKNMVMKVTAYFVIAFMAVYLMMFGVAFAGIFSESSREAYDMLDGGIIIFLAIDFFFRFGMQETPAQEIKPYKLLPIPADFLLNVFLVRTGLRGYNLFWMFFFVPFSLLTIMYKTFYGLIDWIGYIVGVWLVFVFNAYYYLFWRTLVNRRFYYLLLPTAIYAALIYWGLIEGEWFFYASMHLMQGFISWNPLCWLIMLVAISLAYFANIYTQRQSLYFELAKVDIVQKVRAFDIKLLDRFGQIGEYMKLEVKSTIRNKVVRKQFLIGAGYTLAISCLFAFTDVYDASPFMAVFICIYCFACLGVMTLTGVMGMEGNYIDLLMSRRESVLSLLKAKYYYNCLMMLFPLLFTIMPVVQGKIELTETIGCMFFSSGVIFPFLFQLAVYNNTTLHLNEVITRSGRSTKAQAFVSMLALFVPMLIMQILVLTFSPFVAGLIMTAIGFIGTVLHPWWLRNIYRRFMTRRYENMEGFRKTT